MLTCDCGANVPFDDADLGSQVYCQSCGRAVDVPAAPADGTGPDFESDRARSLFSMHAADTLQDRVVGRVTCLCGTSVPVTLAEFGDSVYCPSCGSELATADPLGPYRGGGEHQEPVETEIAASPPSQGRPFGAGKWAGVVLLTLSVIAVLWIGSAVRSRRNDVSAQRSAQFLRDGRPPASTKQGDFDPQAVTLESIEALREHPDPFRSLLFVRGWQQGLRRHSVPPHDPRLQRLTELPRLIVKERQDEMLRKIERLRQRDDLQSTLASAELWRRILVELDVGSEHPVVGRIDRLIGQLTLESNPIGLESIEALLARPDKEAALVEARLWEKTLRDAGVAADDSRRSRLAEVIDALIEDMAPAPDPAPAMPAQMDQIVGTIRHALRTESLEQARAELDRASALLAEHPDGLAMYKPRLESFSRQLERLQSQDRVLRPIFELIQKSAEVAETGDVTAAVHREARARLLASRTPTSAMAASKLKQAAADASQTINLARGRRAVEDALECEAAGDAGTRNREVRRAMSVLPGLPENEIRPLIDQIRSWEEDALLDSLLSARSGPVSEFGRSIADRDLYESLFPVYASGDLAALIDAALKIRAEFSSGDAEPRQWDSRVGELVLDAIAFHTRELDEGVQTENSPQTRAKLTAALERARIWSDLPQWETLSKQLQTTPQ